MKAPDGYEIVDREKEAGDTRVGDDWIFYIHDQERWCPSRSIGEFLYLLPSETIYARPIRKRTLWVPASEQQPPVDVEVLTRNPHDGGYLRFWARSHGEKWSHIGLEWLDLDAVDEIESERDKLAAEVERLREECRAWEARTRQEAEYRKISDENDTLRARIAEIEREIMALSHATITPEANDFVLEDENEMLRRKRDALVDGLVRGLIGICREGEFFRVE